MKKYLFPLMCVLFLAGCTSWSEEPTRPDHPQTGAAAEAYVSVPAPIGLTVNQNVINQAAINSNIIFKDNIERTIESIDSISNTDGETVMYVVNYTDSNGFIILSSDTKQPPVLGFAPTGHFDTKNYSNTGASVWVSEQSQILSIKDEIRPELVSQNNLAWAQLASTKILFSLPPSSRGSLADIQPWINSQIYKWEDEGYTVYHYIDFMNHGLLNRFPSSMHETIKNLPNQYANAYYGDPRYLSFFLVKDKTPPNRLSMCKTKWSQSGGFEAGHPNNYLPGCTTVAAGQIMYYNRFPSTFAWDQMHTSYPTTTTANFLYELGKTIGVNFGAEKSSANIDQVFNALTKYGYTRCKIQDHNINTVHSNLNSRHPVLMKGVDSSVGHAWVCDGYMYSGGLVEYKFVCVENCPEGIVPSNFDNPWTHTLGAPTSTVYYSMNWGWGGYCDGYFLDDNIKIYANGSLLHNFAKNRQEIINIYQ